MGLRSLQILYFGALSVKIYFQVLCLAKTIRYYLYTVCVLCVRKAGASQNPLKTSDGPLREMGVGKDEFSVRIWTFHAIPTNTMLVN